MERLKDCPVDGLVYVELGQDHCPECGKPLTEGPPEGTDWGDGDDSE